jgi:SNF2 family DNA or RNA helicase
VDKHFVTKLMRHQVKGVKFMLNALFKPIENDNTGCILAHCMGSGKTLQVVALVHTVLTNPAWKVLSRSFLLFFLLLDINSRELLIVFFFYTG